MNSVMHLSLCTLLKSATIHLPYVAPFANQHCYYFGRGVSTSFEHFAAAVANLSIGRVRPGIVVVLLKFVIDVRCFDEDQDKLAGGAGV